MSSQQWYTRLEAAQYLRVHPTTLDRYVRQGLLRRHKLRGVPHARYSASDLLAMHEPMAADETLPVRGAAHSASGGAR
jgi:excisionase family DNA binding protein